MFKAAAKLYGARVNLKCHKTLVMQQLLFVKIYFYCMCMSVYLRVCMCTMTARFVKRPEDVESHGTGVNRWLGATVWVLRIKSLSPLQEQVVLTAKPSLQP